MSSKLGPALKALIEAPYAKPGVRKAPKDIASVYQRIARDANAKNVGSPAWICIATGTTMTLNCPDALHELYKIASTSMDPLCSAELIRDIGLKCMGFNGIPKTINMLNAFRSSLPESITSQLSTTSTRKLQDTSTESILSRGQDLWNSIYHPFADKLIQKLSSAHPDLPIHILQSEYGLLFSDSPIDTRPSNHRVGRVLTSLVAISCLRAQTGAGPQLLSHIYGLRKAFEDGTAQTQPVRGGEWLASDQGGEWTLNTIDQIVRTIDVGEKIFDTLNPKAKL